VDFLLIILGIVILYFGGEALVEGAKSLATRLGLSPLLVGLTVVSFGTSAPELAASLTAALAGAPAVAVGNVIGSNIANIGLVLGLTALVTPLVTGTESLRRELPVMLGASLLLLWPVRDGTIDRHEGAVLFLGLLLYLWILFRQKRGEGTTADGVPGGEESRDWSLRISFGMALLGVLLLAGGAYVLVPGAVGVARSFVVTARVTGLTMVAFGTRLPELATCVVAARKKESGLVIGNLIGSNIFNILAILGLTSLVLPIPGEQGPVYLDLIVMLAFSLLLWPALRIGDRVGRVDGVILILLYCGYVVSLFL